MAREVEVKLADPSGTAAAGLAEGGTFAGRRIRFREERVQEDTYLDTPDRALHRAGRALRIRKRDGRRIVSLKTRPGAGERGAVMDREEVRLETEGPDLPEEILELLPPTASEAALRPVARILTHRRLFDLVGPEGREAELCLDRSTVYPGTGGHPAGDFAEIEVEDRGGGRELLRRAAAELAARFGLSPSGKSKRERALEMLGRNGRRP